MSEWREGTAFKLDYGKGAVYAQCACGRSFSARGSRAICDFMMAAMQKHVRQCQPPEKLKENGTLPQVGKNA